MIKIVSGDGVPLDTFRINDFLRTPDAGDVIVSCTDQSGNVLHAATVSFDADFGIPQGLLVVSSGSTLSFFNLKVQFQSEGKAYVYRDVIRANKDFMLVYNESDVRALLGVSQEELPNEDIDVYHALNELVTELGDTIYDDDYMTLNEVVRHHEALRQVNSLYLKVLQKDEVGDIKKTRFSISALQDLRTSLQGPYFNYKVQLSNSDQIPETPILEFVTRDDIITGA